MAHHHVFVYGTLKRGFSNYYRLLRDATFLGAARTPAEYTMRSLGGFPGVTKGGSTSIVGEIFEVDDEQLAALDRLEGHPNFYKRQRIVVAGIIVWAYLLPEGYFDRRREYWHDYHEPIESGVWQR